MIFLSNKANALAHTKWMCKYHIVFTPKYRRKIIYNQYRKDLGKILRELCRYKGVEILEGHLMPDHVHILVSIPPKIAISSFMGYLKGKSALMMFERVVSIIFRKFRNAIGNESNQPVLFCSLISSFSSSNSCCMLRYRLAPQSVPAT